MSSDYWHGRPVTNTVYQELRRMFKELAKGREEANEKIVIQYDSFIYYMRDAYPNISEEEIRKALLRLELWGKISVENNGNTLEIRLLEE